MNAIPKQGRAGRLDEADGEPPDDSRRGEPSRLPTRQEIESALDRLVQAVLPDPRSARTRKTGAGPRRKR